jgi:hypothetical protein
LKVVSASFRPAGGYDGAALLKGTQSRRGALARDAGKVGQRDARPGAAWVAPHDCLEVIAITLKLRGLIGHRIDDPQRPTKNLTKLCHVTIAHDVLPRRYTGRTLEGYPAVSSRFRPIGLPSVANTTRRPLAPAPLSS